MTNFEILICIALSALTSYGQTASRPTFDVATIKPSTAGPAHSSGIATKKGRINAENVTLRRCIRGAYRLPEAQILGGPKWLDELRWDIIAKVDAPAEGQELMTMLQSLLADRFNLSVHREERLLAGYVLVVAKAGLKAKSSAIGTAGNTNSTTSGRPALTGRTVRTRRRY